MRIQAFLLTIREFEDYRGDVLDIPSEMGISPFYYLTGNLFFAQDPFTTYLVPHHPTLIASNPTFNRLRNVLVAEYHLLGPVFNPYSLPFLAFRRMFSTVLEREAPILTVEHRNLIINEWAEHYQIPRWIVEQLFVNL